jgi:hypothetical protein
MGGSTSTAVVPPYLGADPAGSRSAEDPEQALDVGDARAEKQDRPWRNDSS